MTLHGSGYRPSPFPPLLLLQAVLPSKFLIFSDSFYIGSFLGAPVAAATTRQGAYYSGHGHQVRVGQEQRLFLFLASCPPSFLFFVLLPREPQTLLLPGERCAHGIRWLESLPSKSYLISLLTGSKGVTGMEPGWQRPSNAQQGGQAQ